MSRVSQMDAATLDDELDELLVGPLATAVGRLDGGRRWVRAVGELLRLAVLGGSLVLHSTSYGGRLSSLHWEHARQPLSGLRAAIYALGALLPAHLAARARDAMLLRRWPDGPPASRWPAILRPAHRRRTLWTLAEGLDRLVGALRLALWLRFLLPPAPRSPALLDRLLAVTRVPAVPAIPAALPFDLLSRQIVWHSLTHFILSVLPLVDLRRLRLRLRLLSARLSARLSPPGPDDSSAQAPHPKTKKSPRAAQAPTDQCPICLSRRLASSSSSSSALLPDPSLPLHPSSAQLPLPRDASLKIPYRVDCCNGLYCYACLLPDILRWRERHLDHQPWICWRCDRSPTHLIRSNGSTLKTPS